MSILLSSNLTQADCGFPINPISNIHLVEIASYFKQNGLNFDFLDAQELSHQNWKDQLKKKQAKVIVIQCDTAYFQNLKDLKKDFEKTILIVVCPKEELINSLIFDFGIDYVYLSFNYQALVQLVQAVLSPFAMFYDHIPNIVYKNGHGELTKTPFTSQYKELTNIESSYCLDFKKIVLPSNYQIDRNNNNIEILNGVDTQVLTDYMAYNPSQIYTSYPMHIPASNKALSKIISIIQSVSNPQMLTLYPSCDIQDDHKQYSKMSQAIKISLEIKKSGFFKRILLKIKLNNIR